MALAAIAACAPAGYRFEQDCTLCHDARLRDAWGCDTETAEPLFVIDCPVCSGASTCAACGGSGSIPIHRCPNQLFERVHVELVQACVHVEQGVLPDAGGWQDQAATFVEAYPIVMREVQKCREQQRQVAIREAEQKRG